MPTSTQIKLIHIAKGQLGLTDTEYRDVLRVNWGVDSSKELTPPQAQELLTHFEDLGWERRPGPATKQGVADKASDPGYRPDPEGLVNPSQLAVIKGLWDCLGWYDNARRNWVRRIIKKPWPQTQAEAQKIIYSLMKVSAENFCHLFDQTSFKDALTPWETRFVYGPGGAKEEFETYLGNAGRRGRRQMPRVSLTKMIEICKDRSGLFPADWRQKEKQWQN